jgi:hypothetical protein
VACNESVCRVRPFCLKIFFAYKRNKANLDPFHMCFAISLGNFTHFFSLFSLFFALNFSLRFDLVIFTSKRNEGENFFPSKEAKFNIFRIISLPNFVSGEKKTFLSVFLLNFRLFYLFFRFRFLVFRIEVNHVK